MRSQLELRDNLIRELKRLYKDSREAEARNAEVVHQLRVELARHEACMQCSSAARHNLGVITTDTGDLQQQNVELRDHIAQLQSQLRFLN